MSAPQDKQYHDPKWAPVAGASLNDATYRAGLNSRSDTGPSETPELHVLDDLAKGVHDAANRAREMAARTAQLAERIGVSMGIPETPTDMAAKQAIGIVGVIEAGLFDLYEHLTALDRNLRQLERL